MSPAGPPQGAQGQGAPHEAVPAQPAAAAASGGSGAVASLTLLRLQRALRKRLRYRYVRPQVLQEGDAFRIRSPNCSRRVDPGGGMIDIGLLVPAAPGGWCLCSRDHAGQRWVPRLQGAALDPLLDALCTDRDRQFWP